MFFLSKQTVHFVLPVSYSKFTGVNQKWHCVAAVLVTLHYKDSLFRRAVLGRGRVEEAFQPFHVGVDGGRSSDGGREGGRPGGCGPHPARPERR